MFEIHGIKTQFIVVSFSCHAVSTNGQCTGEYVSAVIVGMFTDQIHTSRCKISLGTLCISKYFCESLQNRLFHFHFLLLSAYCVSPVHLYVLTLVAPADAAIRILLLYVFIIIEKNKYFYLFLFFRSVIMLKATSHAKTKRKIHRGSLLTEVYLSFWIYTATAVHEAGALAPANAHGVVPGSLLTEVYLSFWIYTATAVHEAGALAPANAHGVVPGSLLTKAYLSFWIYTATTVHPQALQCLRMGMA